ncbi:MAG: hypothetical protein QXS03_01780 [Candidatus Micrarchaeaceae archaeon]
MVEDNENIQQEFYGKYMYDNIHQYTIEEAYPQLVAKIVAEERKGNYLIEDPQLIGEITYFLSYMIELADKYDAVKEIDCDEINPQTGEKFTLESYAKYVDSHSVLAAIKTKKIISELGRRFVVVMAKKAAMRKGKADRLPFLYRVAQKLQFTKWTDEETQYLQNNIHNGIHRAAFLLNHYRVIEDGEIHMLVSGDNRSGKTGISIRFLIYSWRDLNGFFRPYIEEQLAQGKYLKTDGTEYKKFEELVPPKFKLADRMIFLDRKRGLNLLASSPFPDLLYDEGNFTNLNLKSMDPESINDTIVSFGARNKHPFVIYNYQNSSRPTLFLREKFNVWFHKIHVKYGFLLIRQRLVVPGKDPWLVGNLDKIIASGNDDAIYSFFKRHPYMMREFKNIRDMPPKIRFKYELLRQREQAAYLKAQNIETMLDEAREQMAINIAKQIRDGKILVSSIDEILLEKGVRTQSERLKIKNLINGILTHEAILELAEKNKKS